jgi:hypothetical protein
MRRTGWARAAPVRALREFVQVVGVKNVMRNELRWRSTASTSFAR